MSFDSLKGASTHHWPLAALSEAAGQLRQGITEARREFW